MSIRPGGQSPSPAIGTEEHLWNPQRPPSAGDRLALARAETHYRAAVPARIAEIGLTLDPQTAAAAEDARAEISRFDAELSALVGDEGEFAPMASVLLRTESASSSQIENITAGARTLALAELGFTRFGSNATQVLANVDAMQRALALAHAVTPDGIRSIHEALMRTEPRALPGEFRRERVWIRGADAYPHGAGFIPPHHSRIHEAIADLTEFCARPDLPLLAQTAVGHAQFETIHPFIDGNGRTGRALVHAMLKKGGATTRTTVPVSAGLLTDTGSYFDALTAYRAGDPNPIVARFADAAFTAISNGRALAADLQRIHSEWRERLGARSDSVAWRILPVLLSQPAVTSNLIQERCGASQPATDRALRQLLDHGIVKRNDEHGRERRRDVVWRSDEVLQALDDFAARARRRNA